MHDDVELDIVLLSDGVSERVLQSAVNSLLHARDYIRGNADSFRFAAAFVVPVPVPD